MARTVPAGQVIGDGDVRVVRVSADPDLDLVPADRRDDIVGQTAAADLVQGSLLTEGQVGDDAELLQQGEAVVGVTLPAGEVPTETLRPGDRVLVVQTAPAASLDGEDDAAAVLTEARVFAVEELDGSTGTVRVSIVVDDQSAPAVASANALDRVRLVLVPAEGGGG